jgi:hypothetical protein
VVLSIDDCIICFVGHGAFVAKEVTHFMEVACCELCRGGFKGGEALTYVGGGAVESGTSKVRV